MGRYKCHHVAATLFYGYKKASKTDVKCSWLKNPKSAQSKVTTTMEELFPQNRDEMNPAVEFMFYVGSASSMDQRI